MKRFRATALSVVAAATLLATSDNLRAQTAAAITRVPPVNRNLYIMPLRADSASFATFRRLAGDTIVYMGLISQGTFTQMQQPLAQIGRIEMAELADWQAVAQRGALFGGLSGVAIGGGGAAIGGKRVASAAIVGGLAGALIGYILGGQSAEGRVVCWRGIYQHQQGDSVRLGALRQARSPLPACAP